MTQGYTKGVPIDTDPTLAADSNQLVPSQAAVVTYVTTSINNHGAGTITGSSGGPLSQSSSNWNILGSGSITTSGASNTLTVQLTGLTNHALLVGAGTATITKLGLGSAGQVLQSGGAGADPVFSTATYPATATGTGTILRADGTNWVATTATVPDTAAQGDLLYGSASNVWSSLAKNTTATRYLSNTGSSNNPAWAQVDLTNGVTGVLPIANGGTNTTSGTTPGNRVLLSTQSPTSVATVDFTSVISSTYTVYELEIINAVPATNADTIFVRVGTGAGPTWQTSNYTTYGYQVTNGVNNVVQLTAQSEISFRTGISSTASNGGACVKLSAYNLNSGSLNKLFIGCGNCHSATVSSWNNLNGSWVSTTAVTGIRVLMSSGQIASGTFNLYGIAK